MVTPGKTVIKEMINEDITLLVLTINDFGSVGPLAEQCFYDVKNTHCITDNVNLKTSLHQEKRRTNKEEKQDIHSTFPKSNSPCTEEDSQK